MPRENEAAWQRAKAVVRRQYPDKSEQDNSFWALVQHIYQNMKSLLESDVVKCVVTIGKAAALHDRLKWHGLDISIENRPGTMRTGIDPEGKPWATLMMVPYGYFRRTNGLDEEQIDCFIGGREDAGMVYVINTRSPSDWRSTNEQKVMVNFGSANEVKQCFLDHYPDDRHFSSMTEMPVDAFVSAARETWDEDEPSPIRGRVVGRAA